MKRIIIALLVITLMLSGCSNKSEPKEQGNLNDDNLSAEASQNPEEEKPSEIETRDSEIGKFTIVKKDEEVGAVQESGPFIVKVNQMQVANLDVNEDYRSEFDGKEAVTIVVLDVSVENNSTETNTIYPNQGTIVTNTKEQKEAELSLCDDIGGEFMGEVIKDGNVMFVLDSKAEDITDFKYIISKPIDSNWDSLGDEITFELEFK